MVNRSLVRQNRQHKVPFVSKQVVILTKTQLCMIIWWLWCSTSVERSRVQFPARTLFTLEISAPLTPPLANSIGMPNADCTLLVGIDKGEGVDLTPDHVCRG